MAFPNTEAAPADAAKTNDAEEPLPTYTPATDIYTRSDAIVVTADMPGVGEGDVDIRIEDNALTINGRAQEEKREGYSLIYSDYAPGVYERSFALPADIDRSKVTAEMKHGVLTVVLPKSEDSRPRRIPVHAA